MKIAYLFIILFLTVSCGKEFLDVKRQSNQVIPSTIDDYLALLSETSVMVRETPGTLMLIGGEEYTISDEFYNALIGSNIVEKNAYLWEAEIFEGLESKDWNRAFQRIMYANLAREVEHLAVKTEEERRHLSNTLGVALFQHAWNYFRLMLMFGEPYHLDIENKQCPIPYREDYDVEDPGQTLTYRMIFDKLIDNLSMAATLLEDTQPSKVTPNRAAALTLLAKIYLQLYDYEKALQYSDLAIKASQELLDYNSLDVDIAYPFTPNYGKTNPEVLLFQLTISVLTPSRTRMELSEELWEIYEDGDLRKKAFFSIRDGRRVFSGSYEGGATMFVGISTSETYLIRAECNARLGVLDKALNDLNYLRSHRFDRESFVPLESKSKDDIMRFVLEERRRELCFRGVRWEDLKRMNAEGLYTVDLHREINGTEYFLRHDDERWNWPLPARK